MARTLERVVVSVPFESLVHDSGGGRRSEQASLPFLLEVFGALFTALPAYTALDIVVSARGQDPVFSLLEPIAGGRHLRAHVIEDPAPRFLVTMPTGGGDDNDRIARSRAAAARRLFGPAVIEAGFVFEGGNLSVDTCDSGLRVFVGFNDFWLTTRASITNVLA